MSEEVSNIGAIIKTRRKQLRLSQKDLAELSDVSIHTLSDIEVGIGNPTLKVLTAVVGILGLKIELNLI